MFSNTGFMSAFCVALAAIACGCARAVRRLRNFAISTPTSLRYSPLATLLLVLSISVSAPTASAQVAYTNSTAYCADNSNANRTFSVPSGDFATGAVVSKVTIAITFEKKDAAGANCSSAHGGGTPYNDEIIFRLTSPGGTTRNIVNANQYAQAGYGGTVTVTFDDTASAAVSGTPTTGSYKPVQTFSNFNAQNPAGTWRLYIQDDTGNDPLSFVSATLTVTAVVPQVSLSANTPITEAAGVSTVTATLDRASYQAVTVNLAASGTAVGGGTDYTLSGTTITIAAGSTTGTRTITAFNDLLDEDDETVLVDISSVTNAAENGTQQTTTVITDNDASPTVTLTRNNATIAEAAGTSTFTATLSAVSGRAVTVDLGFSGTATGGGTDYTASSSIVIAAGSTTGTSVVTAVQDTLDESNETVIVDIVGVTNGTESGAQQGTTTITDDDATPSVTLSLDSASIAEAAGVATFTATLSALSGRDVTVNLTYSGTATTTTDYTRSGTSITITAGNLTGTATVTAVQDPTDEVNETVIVDISTVTNGTESGTQQQTTSITDDDGPTVTLSVDNASIAEAAGVATFTATLSATSVQTVTVSLSYSGTAVGGGTDYSVSSSTITILAGATTGTVTATAVQDPLDESNETIIADISSVTNGSESGSQQQTTAISDDDPTPTVTLTVDTTPIAEAADVATFTATLSAVSGQDVTVNLAYSGTATDGGTDYNASANSITILAGSTTGAVTVTSVQDAFDETAETVIVDVSSVTNGTESGTQQQTATITDDDPTPSVTLSVDNATISEAAAVATFTATLSAVSGQAVTVNLAFSGTATGSGTDYSASSASISIPAGSASGTITVTSDQDSLDELDETVIVDVSSVTNATESGTQQQTTTITDDDAPPSVTLSVDNSSIVEAAGVATFTATLSAISSQTVTVNLAYTGTATGGGTDYSASSSTITILAGNSVGSVTVTAVQDALDESDETVIADISSVVNGTESGSQQQTTAISDDDATPTVTLTVDNATIAEAAAVATYTATLSAVSGQNVTVNLAFTGTATGSGTDYSSSAASISIPAGSTSGTVTVTAVQDGLDETNETVIVDISSVSNATESGVQQETTTITDDDDAPIVTLSVDSATIAEAAGVATFTATLDAVSGLPVTVNLSTSGTAVSATDYNASGLSISIPAGSLTGTITVTAVVDALDENDETVVVDISSVVNATESGTQQETTTIVDDDDAPSVTLSVDSATIAEAAGVATFTATLDAVSGLPVTVNLAASGTAISPTDYNASGLAISIPAGSLTGTITVTAVTDSIDENDETVIVDIASVVNATESGTQQETTTVTDDDPAPTVALSVDSATIAEAAGVATFTATLDAVSGLPVTVNLAASGTAVSATDYNASGLSISIPAGTLTGTITVTAVSDAIDENDETVIVDISSVVNATESGTQQETTTIVDDDAAPVVSLSVDSATIAEAAGVATFTATLDAASGLPITVNLAASGTAISATDYNASGLAISIPAGSLTGTVTVTAVTDAIDENDETVIVDISSVVNATESGTQQETTTIVDDDDAPTVTLSVDSATIAEAVGVATFTATLDATSGLPVTVNLSLSGTALSATDYTASDAMISIPAGSLTGTITVTAITDAIDENDETVIVDISSVVNATESGTQQETTTIVDDDSAPTVTLSVDSATIAEAAGVATFTATLDAVSGLPVTVNLAASGTAISATDYNASGLSISIPAGSLTGTVTVTAVTDAIDENDETVIVDISSVVNATESGTQQETTTIVDDDAAPTVTLGVDSATIAEAAGVATFTATLDAVSGLPVTVNLAASGTAISATDYNASGLSISVPAGSLTGTITVTAITDAIDENDETVIVDISSVVNATESGTQQETTTIVDDDAAPTVTLSVDSATIAEAAGVATFTATLDAVSGLPVTVNLAVSGTAVSATDFNASGLTISIPAGSLTGTITVTAITDAIDENDETVIVDISSVVNATESGTQQETTTIVDDDDAPAVTLSVDSATIAEAAGVATFTATLDAVSGLPVTVNLAVSGTAVSATDYNASGLSISIPAGSVTGTITVTAVTDAIDENDETVIVDISSVVNATESGTQQETTTIVDDDDAPVVTLSVDSATIAEAAGVATFTATLDAVSGLPVTVNLAASGTAISATDYNASGLSISIAAGSLTGTITVTAVTDAIDENDETVIVDISSVVNATESGTQQETTTIVDDDDAPTVTLSVDSATIAEAAGVATFTATLDAVSGLPVTVNLAASGTAISATDYNASGLSISIPAGSITGTISVTAVTDALDENDETVIVDISSVVNATESGTQQETTTIVDDDAAPTVTLSVDSATIAEAAGVATFTATLDAVSGLPVTVNLAVSGTAVSATDYNASGLSISIPAGSLTGTITVTAVTDAIDENDETVIVDISSVVNATESGTQQETTTIVDDDDAPVVTLSIDNATVVEAAGVATFTATLDAVSGLPVTVNLAVSGTAISATDYNASGLSISVPAGSLTGTITVTAITDAIDENDETVIVDISSVVNATESGTQQETTTIIDDDDAPVVTLSVDSATIAEAAGVATFTATLDAVSGLPVTVNLAASGTAIGATDFNASGLTISIPAGSLTGTITVTAVTDAIDENDETVIVDISSVVNATESGTQQETTTIVDDDDAPTVTLSVDSATIAEAAGVATFTATLDAVSGLPVTVNLAASGTAISATDYNTSGLSISIPAGSLTGSITVTAVTDAIDENDETVIVDISSVVNATESGTQQETTTIVDDDAAPTVTLSVDSATIAEAAGVATFTATLDAVSGLPVTVNLAASGTAVSATDYNASGLSISIPAGSLTGTITVTAVTDAIDENDETVIVDISSVVSATESGTQQETTAIVDDDAAPAVTLSVDSATIAEAAGAATFTATLDAVSGLPVTVNLAASGTAVSATDYNASGLSISIPAGSLTGTVTVTAVTDAIDENDEPVIVDISSVVNATESGVQQETTTILDDDDAPVVTLSIDNATIAEAAGVATFTATLDAVSGLPVTVNLAVSGTAISATDYNASGLSISIPAGSLTGTITVTAITDAIDENDETVIVDISSVVNATESGTQQETTTIVDDDDAPVVTLSVDSATIVEAAGVATFTATLDAVSGLPVTVNLAASGTALSATDYNASGLSISIPAGSLTGTIAVTAVTDAIDENDETVIVDISSVVNATESGTQQETTTIVDDDDAPTVTLSVDSATIAEAAGVATFTATLDAVTGLPVTVNLAVSGTAVSATDYSASGLSISIPAGSLSGTITVTAVIDAIDENDETVIVDIASVVNATESGAQQETTTITDDDDAPSVTLSVDASTIAESAGVANFTASLDAVSGLPVTVNLALSGAAISATDYSPSDVTIVIPAGSFSGSITVTAISDSIDENDEAVVVDIASVVNGSEFSTQQATTEILDDDAAPSVVLSVDEASILEAAGVATLTATLGAISELPVTINLSLSGTAVSVSDYSVSALSISIPAGSLTGSVTVTSVADTLDEIDETVIVDIDSTVNANESSAQQQTTTIVDDDAAPSIALSVDLATIDETAGVATFTATLDAISSLPVSVSLALSGTATNVVDYGVSSLSISIPAGSLTGSVTVSAVSDGRDESDETVIVDIDSAVNATESGVQQQTTTITDDDDSPPPPVILAPTDGVMTSDNTPTISGTAQANSTVEIYDGVVLIGTATANGAGAWSFTPASGLSDGVHSFSATATDAAGNTGPASTAVSITIDTVAPAAPIITSPLDGAATNDTTPTISGSAEANSTVRLYDGVTLIATVVADGSGLWTFTPGSPLSESVHSFSATATDATGNTGDVSSVVNLTIDITPPAAPTITSPVTGSITNDNTPAISGTAEANSTVSVFDGAVLLGTAVVDGFGSWSFTPSSPLSDGIHSLTATTTDAAGNISADSVAISLTVDTIAPVAPSISAPLDGALLNDNTPSIVGTAEANSTVEVYDGATLIGTVTADGSGAWSFTPVIGLSDGSHELTATATDSAGNTSAASASVNITIDTGIPSAPSITAPIDGSIINDNTPMIAGTAEANSSVAIYDGATLIATVVADSLGNWSYAPSSALADGVRQFRAIATDAAGNSSVSSPISVVTIDTSAPAAPIISAPLDGATINDSTPTISGTAEAGTTVDIYDGATLIDSVVTDVSGNWTYTVGSPLADGAHSFTTIATDLAGNTGSASAAVDVTIDTVAPGAPTISAPVDGALINDSSPTISGSAEPNSTVAIYDGAILLGTVSANGAGSWTFAASGLFDGSHVFSATATDLAGNTSDSSNSVGIQIDTVAPSAPTIISPLTGALTADSTPDISGFAEANSTVSVYDGVTLLGTTVADGGGNWSFTPGTGLSDGTHSLSATATDQAGNTGTASSAVSLTVDTVAPSAPVIGSPVDGIVNSDSTPTISGTAEANSTVAIYDGVTLIASVVADGSGSWTFTPSTSLLDGLHTFTATATDAAGNTSASSAAVSITIDTIAPAAPVITAPTDGAALGDATPTISGTAEANSTVNIYDGATLIATVVVDGAGVWTFTPGSSLSEGAHSFTATATDAAGGISVVSDSVSVTIDTVSPVAPVITAPVDGAITSDSTPTISGTAEASSTVTVYDGAVVLGTAVTNGAGAWTFTPSGPLSEGAHSFTATATDLAGNTGVVSDIVEITIDTVAPAAPVVLAPVDGATMGDNQPEISGSAEANSTVSIYDGAVLLGTATADGTGVWSFTPTSPLSEGAHSFTATATDAAGNTSEASTSVNITVDTLAPTAPSILTPADGSVTNDNTPEISGTAEADSTVSIYDGVSLLGTAVADGSGAWTFTPSTGLADGSHSFTATATDSAGNVSAASTAVTVTVDTTAPAAPSISTPATGSVTNDNTPTISGTAEANSVVSIYDGVALVGTAITNGAGVWTFTPSVALSNGVHSLTAVATDSAGNTSAPSATSSFTVDTTSPAAPVITSPVTGAVTNDNTPTFSGTAEANSTVSIFDGATLLGTTTANSSGAWTFTPVTAMSNATHSIIATATDGAGNVSPASAAVSLRIDTVAPTAPVISSPANGSTTSDDTPTVTGTAEANSTVHVFFDNVEVATVTANSSGVWSFTPVGALAGGVHTVKARANDAAGNLGSFSATNSFTVSLDADGDGLTNAQEAVLGTDPNRADTDNDGVRDGQEVTDGSAPLDRGSNIPVLPKTICSLWNGFLSNPGLAMWNIMEHVNMSNVTLNVSSTLYSIDGVAQSTVNFAILPGAQYDLLVHDMVGWRLNSYGQVCSTITNASAAPGDLDGRMSFYKPINPALNSYEFAFALPFRDGVFGSQFVLFNTFQASEDPTDSTNVIANWIQITNQEATSQSGTVYYYNQAGALLGSQAISLPGRGRQDVAAHQFGANKAGIVEWRPASSTAKFSMINAEYRYDNAFTINSFDSAYQFEGAIGSGQLLSVPVDTTGATAVLEVGNTKSTAVTIDVNVYNLNGSLLSAVVLNLAAHASQHLLLDGVLGGQRGIATISVRGGIVDSAIGVVKQYGRTSTRGLQYFYGIQARQALGSVLRSSYNTFLNQGCSVYLTNPAATSKTATISMRRYDGTNVLSGQSVTVPARGGYIFDACSRDISSVYGVVTVLPTTTNSIFGSIIRRGNQNDYQFPTPLRQ